MGSTKYSVVDDIVGDDVENRLGLRAKIVRLDYPIHGPQTGEDARSDEHFASQSLKELSKNRRFQLDFERLGLVVSRFSSRSHLSWRALPRTGRGKRGDKILTCSCLFSHGNFLKFEEKERDNDVRFAKKNVLPTSDSLLLAKMHVAKTLSAVALPNFGLVTS